MLVISLFFSIPFDGIVFLPVFALGASFGIASGSPRPRQRCVAPLANLCSAFRWQVGLPGYACSGLDIISGRGEQTKKLE